MVIRFIILFCASLFTLKLSAQDSNGFVTMKSLTPIPITRDTGEKPQSKVWSHGCYQWAVLSNAEGAHLFRLDETNWTKVLTLSEITYNADIKVIGNLAHVLLYRGKDNIYLVSLEFEPASGNYKLWSKRPEPSALRIDREAETATIDIDSKGRMWLASDAASTIEVRWSDAPYTKWSDPITLATGVNEDDIAAVVALPGKIGVLWSNINKQRFGFKTHVDGAEPSSWSSDEVPASQSALNVGGGMADDHINLAVASDGTLYAAVKTEYNKEGYPMVGLLIRRPSGSWDNFHEVTQSGTRPIIILNEEVKKLKVIYTTSTQNGNDIVYKETSLSKISFTPELLLIKGPYNNATSSKANYTSDVVILASNETQAVGVLGSDGLPPEVCPIYFDWKAYPNPFSSKTTLHFTLSEGGPYSLILYNSRGAKVGVIHEGTAGAGEVNTVEVEGKDLASGVYFLRLDSKEISKSMKLVHIK